ncbi:MAG: signal peptidase II [Firmicutes bacterium]|nr:signal peptidase II [Bacillota bacterium]
MIILIPIIAIIVLDQLSKMAVRSSMSPGDSISVIGNFFRITYFRNEGAAFSSLVGQRVFLIVISAIVTVAAFVFLMKYRCKSKLLDLSLVLVIGGGIGNLIDRIAFGYVTDMLSFSIFPPIFNVADIAITCGCFLLIIFVLFSKSEVLK